MHFNLSFYFFLMIHTYYVILGVIFLLFLAQNFRTKVLTVQKNLLLECLPLDGAIDFLCKIGHHITAVSFVSAVTSKWGLNITLSLSLSNS